jgi:glycosyltransferase involved in cell wall biosynthesis
MFVHVRNLYYMKQGMDVTVLNFRYDQDYEIDGVQVIALATYEKDNKSYDIAVSHSSNVRNHYWFFKKHANDFQHIVFFFHGHEILRLNEAYPAPYSYMKSSGVLRRGAQDIYDSLKFFLWKKAYKKLAVKSDYVFVSNWLFNRFKSNTGLTESALLDKCHIINNSVGSAFETAQYDWICEKNYDFITIRSNLDGSKYCVDLVMKIARDNPSLKFLLIGHGQYFNYYPKPSNVEWLDRTLSHTELISYLNRSRCCIMPTRLDAQGVMMCELATLGIPVITSDIEICREFSRSMPNVALIDNESSYVPVDKISKLLCEGLPFQREERYFAKNTIFHEVCLFNQIMNDADAVEMSVG